LTIANEGGANIATGVVKWISPEKYFELIASETAVERISEPKAST
jgi:hypothetical protein